MYYFHKVTRQTQWDKPEALLRKEAGGVGIPPSTGDQMGGGQGCVPGTHPGRGKTEVPRKIERSSPRF